MRVMGGFQDIVWRATSQTIQEFEYNNSLANNFTKQQKLLPLLDRGTYSATAHAQLQDS